MKLHLLGLPHTVSNEAASHCAFTGKVQRFPAMIARAQHSYEVVHYGVEGADTAAVGHVDIMTRDEQTALRGHDGSDRRKFVGDDTDINSPLYREFNRRLRAELRQRVVLDDLVLLPFGWGHGEAVSGLPFNTVESGIGYPDLFPEAKYRIFESFAWMHYHQGRANRSGHNYEWVVPNYFDVDEWQPCLKPDMDTVVYMGRICAEKGLATVVEVARAMPALNFILCGQGDPAPYLTELNIHYCPPVSGRLRSPLLAGARCVIMPTMFTEPFGGVAVEAQLCGTPVVSSSFGAFTETVEDYRTGFRCHTLGDYIAGIERAPCLDRQHIRNRAQRLYGYSAVARQYDRAFQQIADMAGAGWYSRRSIFDYRAWTATR